MKNELDPTNRSALQFNIESEMIMSDICKSILDKEIGITNFTYCRTFNNGTRLYLCDNSEWVRHYLSNNFQEDLEHLEFYTPGNDLKYALWTAFKEDRVLSSLRNHFNLWYGFNIYEKHEDYIDIFDFVSHTNNHQITNYYLNNLDTLNNKVKYFKEKAADLIDPTDKRKLMVSKNWKPFSELSKNSLFDSKRINDFMIKTRG